MWDKGSPKISRSGSKIQMGCFRFWTYVVNFVNNVFVASQQRGKTTPTFKVMKSRCWRRRGSSPPLNAVSQQNRAQRTPGEPYRRCKGSQKLDGSVFLANVPLLPGAHSGHVSNRVAAAASRRLLISVRESSDLDRLLCRSRSPYCGYSPFLLLSFLLCCTASNHNRGQNSGRSLPRSVTTFKFLKTPERTTARAGLSCAAFRAASFASQFVAHRKNID